MLPPEFVTIKQPPASPLCGAAVCAMALGKTLEQVVEETDYRVLSHTLGMIQYLLKFDVSIGLVIKPEPPMECVPDRWTARIPTADHPAIVCVRSAVNPGGEHWVFWDGKQIRDPSPVEQETYTILEFYPLHYWQDKPFWRPERIGPADWREWKYKADK